ncbi:hypothetical protein LEMA_P052840.1 [Plenodomus lingam JN3]|uniref:F-box domain-containing protein n=2 Tax=Leptosphaeria maculans TaxID=5022 RepID=E4ZMX5_LEPMJ|nr:hypothetical protein LEMA_P052840.1 [Plenodomus lingam JN3]CBX92578.1 hypothetical protein LEMA_P052840.1 [Plenodomus lingam JN3]
MMDARASSATAFNSLPIELNKAIAHGLESDKDIATYRLVCQATNNAIDADNKSFWRARFRRSFVLQADKTNGELQKLYQRRSKLLRRGRGYTFFFGNDAHEQKVTEVLRDLIVDSFKEPPERDEQGRLHCKNQERLREFILNSRILIQDRRVPPASEEKCEWLDETLIAVKLMCAHFLFEFEGIKHQIFAFEESQRAVYKPSAQARIFRGGDMNYINFDWLGHCLDFFRHHMMSEEAYTLFENISELPATQKPSAWRESLKLGARPLSRHWKGTYSFLDAPEIAQLRRLTPAEYSSHYFIDKNVDEGKIQSLELEFVPKGKQMKWPQIFEDRLHSLDNSHEARKRPQGKGKARIRDRNGENIQFVGTGEDLEDDFNAIGWLNPLPAQKGIPGWQRITFMKHFMENFDEVEQDNLWAYEGIVLPGGRMILGRWWYASEQVDFNQDYNGPFILWAVDPEPDSEASVDVDGESADDAADEE